MVNALVITGYGFNCEEETAAAFRCAGAAASIVHINDILAGHSIHGYDIIAFIGGFSFGDDIASGRVLANKIRYSKLAGGSTLLDEITAFIAAEKYVIGVCNGFQVLVKLGLLPATEGVRQQVTLTKNSSNKFEDRWVFLKKNPKADTPFLKGINVITLPVRHGEGRMVFGEGAGNVVISKGLNVFSYCTREGEITSEYPANPNGAELSCAGLCDTTGRVFGLMPHPEAYLSLYNNPDWPRMKREKPALSDEGEGLLIFKNIVQHIDAQKGGCR